MSVIGTENRAPDNQPPLRLVWLSPAQLAEHPANWRRHPDHQLAALTGAIAEVGWAGALSSMRRPIV